VLTCGGRPRNDNAGIDSAARPNQDKEFEMPFVNVKVIEGVCSAEQKQDIVRKVTDAMIEVEGEHMRPVTWVVVEEVASGAWGIGGTPLHTADVLALAAGQPVG
jgi:4-oxalocrotonate tautomerase